MDRVQRRGIAPSVKEDKPRRHNPEWSDSREARAARQAKRLSRLNAIAQAAGYDTWRKLETAALNGAVISLNTAEIDGNNNVG